MKSIFDKYFCVVSHLLFCLINSQCKFKVIQMSTFGVCMQLPEALYMRVIIWIYHKSHFPSPFPIDYDLIDFRCTRRDSCTSSCILDDSIRISRTGLNRIGSWNWNRLPEYYTNLKWFVFDYKLFACVNLIFWRNNQINPKLLALDTQCFRHI